MRKTGFVWGTVGSLKTQDNKNRYAVYLHNNQWAQGVVTAILRKLSGLFICSEYQPWSPKYVTVHLPPPRFRICGYSLTSVGIMHIHPTVLSDIQ